MPKKILTITALAAMCAGAAVPLKWTVATERVTPVAFDAFHGETLNLKAHLQSYGKPLATAFNGTFFWQTNGMGNVWWQTNATVQGAAVAADFSPAMDAGADRVSFFFGVTDAAGGNYRASGTLRLKPSPGFAASTLSLEGLQTVNFAHLNVLNAPWATIADVDGIYAKKSELPRDYLTQSDLIEYERTDAVIDRIANSEYHMNAQCQELDFRLGYVERAAAAALERNPDLSNYAQLSDIPAPPDLTPYATHGDVATNVAAMAQQLRSEIQAIPAMPDMSDYALRAELPAMPDLTNYAQLSDIPDMPDLSPYATHGEVATNIAQLLVQFRSEMAAFTLMPDLSGYARLEDIPLPPDLTNYAQLSDIPDMPDLSPYATHGDVATNIANAIGVVTDAIGGLSGRIGAAETAISANASAIEENARAIASLPPAPDMSDYALREEIPFWNNLDNYVRTNTFVAATNYLCQKIDDSAPEMPSNILTHAGWVNTSPFNNGDLEGLYGISSVWVDANWYNEVYNNMLVDGSISSVIAEYYCDNDDFFHIGGKFDEVDEAIGAVSNTVSSWEGLWGGDDVLAEVTNYFGSADIPAFLLKQKMPPDATHIEPWYKTIWDERSRWNRFFSEQWAGLTNTVVTFLAERCWGIYDSATGNYSPDGVLQISQPIIQIADGMSYQKTVSVGGSALWVLTANDPMTLSGEVETGFFKIEDGDGNTLFEIVRGDKRVVAATATEASMLPGNVFRIRYNTLSTSHPILEVSRELGKNENFLKEDDPGLDFATVTWSGQSGAWFADVVAPGARSLFARASFEMGGETYIKNHAPITTDKIIIGGTNYNVKVETLSINGVQKQLMVLEL